MQLPLIPATNRDLLVITDAVSGNKHTIRLITIYLGHGKTRDSTNGRVAIISAVSRFGNAPIELAYNALEKFRTLTV